MSRQLILPISLYICKFLYKTEKTYHPITTSRHFSKVGPARPLRHRLCSGKGPWVPVSVKQMWAGGSKKAFVAWEKPFILGVQGQARMGTGTERKRVEWESGGVWVGIARGGARIYVLTWLLLTLGLGRPGLRGFLDVPIVTGRWLIRDRICGPTWRLRSPFHQSVEESKRFLGICPREMETCIHRKTYTGNVYSRSVHNGQPNLGNKCISADE